VSEQYTIDLPVDFQMEDETGLPWTFLREARDPTVIKEGAWIVAGTPSAAAVAQVVDVEDGIVHVRPQHGSVRQWIHLVTNRQSA